jgi:hypothetical protein
VNSGTCACRTGTFDSCPDHPPRDTCPVCLHPAEMHQPDGCWFTMTIARPNSLSGCPCGVRREADAEPNRAPFLVAVTTNLPGEDRLQVERLGVDGMPPPSGAGGRGFGIQRSSFILSRFSITVPRAQRSI